MRRDGLADRLRERACQDTVDDTPFSQFPPVVVFVFSTQSSISWVSSAKWREASSHFGAFEHHFEIFRPSSCVATFTAVVYCSCLREPAADRPFPIEAAWVCGKELWRRVF